MAQILQHHYLGKSTLIAILLLLGIVSWLFPEPASALRNKTSANRECSICHIMWLDDFKREDVTPLIPFDPLPVEKTGKQDVVSTDRMCFSCHDGFVLDSRFLWKKNRHNHPVGVIPTDDVTIPTSQGKTVFPMNEDGKLYCGSCHTAHAQDWDADNTTLFMRMDNSNSNICTACHLNRVDGLKKGNHPIHKELKELPPSLLEAGSKFSDKNEVICQSCHLAHGSEQIKMLARPNQNSDLCSSCHLKQAQVRNTKHNMSIMAPNSKNTRGRVVTDFGPCSACHIPHKARGTVLLWSRPISVDKDQGSAYCLSCHKAGGIAREKTIDANSHPVNVPIKKVGIIADKDAWVSSVNNKAAPKNIVKLPLFDERGKKMEQGGNVTCISCHDPHQWSPDHGKSVRSDDIRKIEGDGSNSFLRIANTEDSALCTNCHRSQATVAYSRHNLGITAPKEKNRDGMSVSRSGVCSGCHLPHNGESTKLWAKKVSKNSKTVSAKCNSCHAKGKVAKNKVTGKNSHPLQVNLEKIGATTDLPLFTRDGKRHKNHGLVDCATCHDPHQWDPANPIAKSGRNPKIEGDGSNSFLRIANTKDSALCTNCHRSQATVAYSRHNLSITAPKEKNGDGMNVSRSGVCSACHLPHNGESTKLWAKKVTKNSKTVSAKCNSCHAKGKVAKNKTTGKNSHPLQVNLKKIGATTNLPLFTKDGKRDDKKGLIDCSTCHDPHQWDPVNPKAKSGRNPKVDGDGSNSFLRIANTKDIALCASCHKKQMAVIGTDHDLSVTVRNATNTLDQTVKQSGVCGQCHTVHNASQSQRLWVQKVGEGKHNAEKLCTGCHSKVGVARDKVPLELTHPPKILSANKGRLRQSDGRRVMPPLFSPDGKPAEVGVISCSTCHDPHQWNANNSKRGSGKNLEGDVSNSFLRHSSTEYFICSDCHAEDSLYRYKYFHWAKSRPEINIEDL